MNAITQKTATPGQIKQIGRFATDAVEKTLAEFDLDKSGAQRVIEHGDEFASGIRETITRLLQDLSVSDKFKKEEVESSHGYLSGYKPKSIDEQIHRLQELFPHLETTNILDVNRKTLPHGAEGWFAIPNWKKIAPTYNEAVEIVVDMIKQTRGEKFYNCSDGELGPERLRQTTKTTEAFQRLGVEQRGCSMLVVPAQFGIRHRGRSVRRAREVFAYNEFGLGAFATGIMLLTHPERIMHDDDLWIYCSGDEYDSPNSDDRFGHIPYFFSGDGNVGFDMFWFDEIYDHCGSASGFLP